MTQDTTPPGPKFKARLLHDEDGACIKTIPFSGGCRRGGSNAAIFFAPPILLRCSTAVVELWQVSPCCVTHIRRMSRHMHQCIHMSPTISTFLACPRVLVLLFGAVYGGSSPTRRPVVQTFSLSALRHTTIVDFYFYILLSTDD